MQNASRFRTTVGLVALGLAVSAAVPHKALAQAAPAPARNGRKRVLVKIDRSRRDRSLSELTSAMRRHNPRVLRSYAVAPFIAMEIDENSIGELSTQASALAVYDDVLVAPSLAQSVPTTEAPAVWSRGYTGGGKAVAVLDTGVDASHPFLSGRVISEACYSTAAGGSVSICPNGRSEQVGRGAAAPCAFGGCFHGTHVAGIVAGNGTPTGRSAWGVAKGADIIAINVFTRFNDAETCGAGNAPCALSYMSDMIAGLERVYELRFTHDIAAVNMSLGGGAHASGCDDSPIKSIIDQLRAAGIATIVASGNEGHVNGMGFPACVSSAISVGAVNNTGVVASFSNVSRHTTLFAPGVNILSSIPGGAYARSNGTSMATPHVAGAWALMSEALPGASVDRILGALVATGVATRDTRAGGSFTKPNMKIERALDTLLPRLLSVSPSVMAVGERGIVTVTGSAFVAGMDVDFGSAITVHSVTVSSPTTLVLDISIAAGAQLGTRELTVSTVLEAKQQQLADPSTAAALEQVGEALALAEPMQAAGEAMAKGDMEKAVEELAKLELPKLDRQTERALTEKLEQAKQNASQGSQRQLREAVGQAAAGITQGDRSKFKEGMEGLAGECKKQSNRKKLSDLLRKQCNCLAECKSECEGECKNDGQGKGKGGKKWGLASSGNEPGEKTAKLKTGPEMQITGTESDAGDVDVETMTSPEQQQEAIRKYREKVEKYEQISESVLESEPIPLGHRQTIRRYFQMIRPQSEEIDAVIKETSKP